VPVISNTAITTTPAARIAYVIGSGRRSSMASTNAAAIATSNIAA
jgi:hypothetical protein